MKRLIRFFTFLGGAGAVAWLLRDRIVSVTTSREPERPEFIPEPARPESGDDLTAIKGIGPTYAARLEGSRHHNDQETGIVERRCTDRQG